MRKILSKCPNCGGEMEVTRLSCTSCETVILARYRPCSFCRLAAESLVFVETFVKNRGNLKEMERELGLSYWALRTQLNDIIQELGYQVDEVEEAAAAAAPEIAAGRDSILARLEQGQITASQAAEALAQLGGAPA